MYTCKNFTYICMCASISYTGHVIIVRRSSILCKGTVGFIRDSVSLAVETVYDNWVVQSSCPRLGIPHI